MSADQRLIELNLELPPAPKPVANYVPAVQVGSLLYLSGHGPLKPDKTLIEGQVGHDLNVEQAYDAARHVGLGMLATLQATLGSLDRVERMVKVLGMVWAIPTFRDHPRVINGFSDLMVEVFGDSGRGARSAVGMGSLPTNIPVEIEAIFKLKD